MKKARNRFVQCLVGVALLVSIVSPAVSAESGSLHAADPNAATAPVIITELATGTKTSGSQEFIELYNTSDQAIDLTGWQLWYVAAQAADPNKPASSGVIALDDGTDAPAIAAHGYYVFSGRSDYLPDIARQFYTGTMAASGGNLRLLSPNADNACALDVQDQLGWGDARYPQGQAAPAPPAGQSLVRESYADGVYADTYNNAADFTVAATPSPGTDNAQQVANPLATAAIAPSAQTVPIAGCTTSGSSDSGTTDPLRQPGEDDAPPATVTTAPSDASTSATGSVFPVADTGLVTPQITELLPNPALPQTDASDEFIELYNSNEVTFDLSGFSLQVGLTTKHKYAFPAGTSLPPKSFVSFFSAQTSLAMSNTSGQVALLDPKGVVTNQTTQYGAAKEGQVWALANGNWYWSTTPTPNGPNIITAPISAAKKSVTTSPKKSTTPKAASTAAAKKTKSAKSKTTAASNTANVEPAQQSSPLHPAVLAIVASFAVLYALYEYRQDMANKLYQFRANRAARRAARAEFEGG